MNIFGCGWSFRKFQSELMKHDRNSWTDLGPMILYFPMGRWRPNGLASIFFQLRLVWTKPGKRWVRGLMSAMVGLQLLCMGMKNGESRCGNFYRGHTFFRVFCINQYIGVMQWLPTCSQWFDSPIHPTRKTSLCRSLIGYWRKWVRSQSGSY